VVFTRAREAMTSDHASRARVKTTRIDRRRARRRAGVARARARASPRA